MIQHKCVVITGITWELSLLSFMVGNNELCEIIRCQTKKKVISFKTSLHRFLEILCTCSGSVTCPTDCQK